MYTRHTTIFYLLFSLNCFCGNSNDIDPGMQIPDIAQDIALEEYFAFNDSTVLPGDIRITYPRDAVVDSAGNIFLLHGGYNVVLKFSPDGTLIDKIGRKGREINEIFAAHAIDLWKKGYLYLIDGYNRRLFVFNRYGGIQSNKPLPEHLYNLRVLSDGRVLSGRLSSRGLGRAGSLPAYESLFLVFASDGTISGQIVAPPVDADAKTEYYLSKNDYSVDGHNTIVISYIFSDLVQRYTSEGELLNEFHLSEDVPRLPEKQFDVLSERSGYIPDSLCVTKGIDTDSGHRIWILVNTRDNGPEDFEFHVYSGSGFLLARVPLPTACDRFRIFGDTMVIINTYGNSVKFYKISDQ